MNWTELTVLTNTCGSELVADILSELGSEGVSIYDSNDINLLIKSDVIWDYIDEELLKTNDVVRVIGYYDSKAIDSVNLELIERLNILSGNSPQSFGSLEILSREIDDEDWVNVWRQYYKPIHINNITVVPVWLKYQPIKGERIVYMDPGKAFGTGEHETTRLCLSMLSTLRVEDYKVADVGCGSGILGVAAKICGAKSVVFSDIDDQALTATQYNADINKIESGIIIKNVLELDKIKDSKEHEFDKNYDLIFANITADVLINLSKTLLEKLKTNGHLILSGIIKKRHQEVLNAYIENGFTLIQEHVLGEWVGMMLSK